MMNKSRYVVFLFVSIFLISCQKRQDVYLDVALAQAALMAAKESKADVYSSFYYRKGETYFLTAKKDYTNKFFSSSIANAKKSRRYSEIAEKKSIIKQQSSGVKEDSVSDSDEESQENKENNINDKSVPKSTVSEDETLDEDPF